MSEKSINNIEILLILTKVKQEIRQYIDKIYSQKSSLSTYLKEDNSIVTELDLFISKLFKEEFGKKYDFLNFYCEEDNDELKFPSIILDPIDGTKELAKNINECAVSFGIYFTPNFEDKRNFSWIYNPFTGFEIHSLIEFSKATKKLNPVLLSYISRTEADKGNFTSNDQVVYVPKGSIAYKLGLLASGACDFVFTKRPKNIWDIMAGSHLCYQRDIFLYQNGSILKSLGNSLVNNDIIWAEEEVWERINFINEK